MSEPNQVVIKAMKDFIGDRHVKTIARETGISRISINSWRLGSMPQLGTLLEHLFVGTPAAQTLAYMLTSRLYPDVAKRLPVAKEPHAIQDSVDR